MGRPAPMSPTLPADVICAWPSMALAPPLGMFLALRKFLQNGGTLRIVSGGSFRLRLQDTSGKVAVNGKPLPFETRPQQSPPPGRAARRDPHRPADGGARRHHRQRGAPPHPD